VTTKFIVDENIPFQVTRRLREAGYEVAAVAETGRPGMKNDDLAKQSIQLRRTIITRDADFTHLKQPLMKRVKVVYLRLSGNPETIAQHALKNIDKCIKILQDHNVAIIDEEGCHTP